MRRFLSGSAAQTEKIAEELAKLLKGGDVIAFEGGMGVGKTCFIRGLARGLGLRDQVSSPTFAIINEYRGSIPLYHFDMYRIESLGDLYSTGFFDYLDQGGICAIEWSENIAEALPDQVITVSLSQGSTENERIIEITGDERF